jgi:hypothetical protein
MASEAEDFGAEVYEEIKEMYAMNAITDPVLEELWDNEMDAEYDRL